MTVNTEQLVRDHLDVRHMTIATTGEDGPLATVLDFVVREEDLALGFRSPATARHIANMMQDGQRVAGAITRQHEDGDTPEGVSFSGTVALVGAGVEQDELAGLFADQRGADADKILDQAASGGSQFYRIDVNEWRYRGAPDGGRPQTYSLPWGSNNAGAAQG